MKRFAMIMAAISGLILMSCGGGGAAVKNNGPVQEPDWALNPPSSSQFYYFVGYTQDLGTGIEVKDKAYKDALSKAVEFIFQEATVNTALKVFGSLNDPALQKDYEQDIKTKAKASLGGLEVEKTEAIPFAEDGLNGYSVWVLCKISKAQVDKQRQDIINEIERKKKLVEEQIKNAQTFISQGKVIDAVNAYVTAAISASKVEERKDEAIIYINLAGNLLKKIFLEADEGVKEVEMTKGAEFTYKVYYSGDDGKIPVYGAQVMFTLNNNKGDYNRTAVTDKEGSAKCKITGLKSVGATKLYANLDITFNELTTIGGDYQKYYIDLKNYVQKSMATASFTAVNKENLNITTSVVALVNKDGEYELIPSMASGMLSYMKSKGFKAVKFPSDINLDKLAQSDDATLAKLEAQGIKRVFILVVDSDSEPVYAEVIKKWKGVYSVSAQLIDTKTGEIYFSDNVRISAAAESAKEVFGSFVKGAENQLKTLIDKL
ncbi:MAG: hypothetical protein A2Y33_05070 [Spirochaetes bacterium GWF1_51_8]|nr:MAG: hypothetical protein A2Y33_05070 [Spirochaetes bacterium GWF1_51_8]